MGASLTYSQTEPDLGLPNFDLESETTLASVFASYPLERTRRSSLFLSGGFDMVDQDVEVNDFALSKDRVRKEQNKAKAANHNRKQQAARKHREL